MSKKRKPKESGDKYHCKHCGKTLLRDSNKQWLTSYCETTGKLTRLMRVKNQ